MSLSIVIPVLNSHEIVRRQCLFFAAMPLPPGVELLLVDDGSDPPITRPAIAPDALRIVATHDTRPWTWALARNRGAREAVGDYLLMTDLDYIIPRGAIEDALAFRGDKMRFRRQFGVLTEHGVFTQDLAVLQQYGLPAKRIAERGVDLPPHPNNFVMRKDLFLQIGGYREDLIERPYPQGEDRWFKREWTKWLEAGRVRDHDHRPTIFMFPNGQFCGDVNANPFGLFHTLTRKTRANPWHQRIVEGKTR